MRTMNLYGFFRGLGQALVFFFLATAAFAEPDQRIVPLSDETYGLLRTLYVQQGLGLPSQSFPYTHEELRQVLRKVDFGKLGEGGKKAYREIEKLLKKQPAYSEEGGFRFYPSFRANAELYLHSNKDYEYWEYGAEERRPFLGLLVDAVFFDNLDLYADFTVQKDAWQTGGDRNNVTSVLTNPYQFDLNMPYRAAFSFGGEHWNLWAGRDLLSWGSGRTGNLMLSDADLYHEGLRFTTYWERFKYTFLVLGLESWMIDAQDGFPDYNYAAGTERYKMFLAHRFEFLLLDNLRFTMNEAIVYGGKYPDLRVFNPLIVYHNLYIKENSNSLITAEVDYTPVSGLLLYGQFAMDQLSTIFEKKAYGKDEEPNAMGYLAGIEYSRPLGGGNFTVGYEFVKTDPWLYIRETPLVSFVSVRRIHSEARKEVQGDTNTFFLASPIGYNYGPDSIVNSFLASYEVPDSYQVFFEYLLLFQGENTLTSLFLTGDAAWDLNTPSGVADVKNVFSLGGWYRLTKELTVFLKTSMVYNGNAAHNKGKEEWDLQSVLSFRFTYD